MNWRVVLEPNAQKELDSLDRNIRERIVAALFKLASNPHQAANVKPLVGGGYRLRLGDYRILYGLRSELLIVIGG